MSASERLKALADLDASTGIGHIKTCTALRNALPQIVAVVEAAEETNSVIIGSDLAVRHPWLTERIKRQRAALASLEEALQ